MACDAIFSYLVNVDEESQIQGELEYNKTTTDKDTNSATAEVDNITQFYRIKAGGGSGQAPPLIIFEP